MAGWLIAAADLVTTGGMDIANLHLARHLAGQGGVELVSHRVDATLAAMPGVTVTNVLRPFGMNMLGEPFLRHKAWQRSQALLKAGGRVIANGGNCPTPDINWVHYVHAAFEPISAGSWLRRRKVHFYHRKCLRQEREAFRAARLILCNSRLTARHVVEGCGIAADRTAVVYYGCDPANLNAITTEERRAMRAALGWSDRPVAVFIGALADRRKGFDVLFTAWTTLCKDPAWDVNLVVIGRGAELAAWQQRTAAAGMSDRIHYLGFRSDVPQVLAACDVIIHPARYEAYGLGVHEAVCRGLPAIVSAEAGVSERLAGTLDDLLLPNPDDAAALADRLRYWRAHRDAIHHRTAPLADRLRSRTWNDMAREIHAAALAVR